jgi:hypothetical protein
MKVFVKVFFNLVELYEPIFCFNFFYPGER